MPQPVPPYGEDFIPTRKSLLSRLHNLDDQESWRVFFETYWKLIYVTALRAGLTETEAEDVVQETVICVAKNIQDFQYDPAKGSFKGYLLRLTNWRINTQFRKRLPLREPRPNQDLPTATDPIDSCAAPVPPALENLWDKEWEANLMEAALRRTKSKVNPKFYQAWDLCVHQNWPVSKIATDLRLTRAQVYLAKHYVAKAIKRELLRLRNKPL